jgi:hypothetical protein
MGFLEVIVVSGTAPYRAHWLYARIRISTQGFHTCRQSIDFQPVKAIEATDAGLVTRLFGRGHLHFLHPGTLLLEETPRTRHRPPVQVVRVAHRRRP